MSTIHWTEQHSSRCARWHSESGAPLPDRVVTADDTLRADTALRTARAGATLLWRGDYHNGRQLLSAMRRRLERTRGAPATDPAEQFRRYRDARARQAQVLSRLVVVLDEDYVLDLRRAPDVRQACAAAYGPASGPMVVSLTELLGVVGAHQWRVRGVEVPALGARIHPHYGVFAPVRGEYVDLVARAPLPPRAALAVDLGTGTGVLAALLARRGIDRVVATDLSERAVACARDNLDRLGLSDRVEVRRGDLFPDLRADLIVCNPPWLPGTAASSLDHGVYDPGGAMLHGYLGGLADHLRPGGEGWLVLSDLAELLGLRRDGDLASAIEAAGLRIVDRLDTKPRHSRAADPTDPLHAARAAETVSLWRLAPR
ncbi:methyltransferase [Nocardia mexicana]|uniref:Methyltransferase family protein n=1 Tax=Nocardia mexicana TaxID=279262 RepID=A0A370HEH3_9NOCA|nr:class I SAM-dependent methyltransferase [Nocardia mexicana]RDI55422.1 methyltransferase family protein [Nocardia mexicana]